jgi:hypothetical protein
MKTRPHTKSNSSFITMRATFAQAGVWCHLIDSMASMAPNVTLVADNDYLRL